jgi:Xaa-Pro aminopeptidase
VPADDILADLGWVKETAEVASIREAVRIADEAYGRILGLVTPRVRECDLAAELEYQMTMLGSEKPAFETIVASGPRSAMPHGIASRRRMKKGDLVTFDFGATIDGYVSDMTRTVVIGRATARQKKIYNIVLRAQKAGIRKIKAGITGGEVDRASREIIRKAGYSKHFGHGVGHGIGHQIHMGPRLAVDSPHILVPNNIVTVEPGIYLSGWGGVRIEDDILVTRKGGTVLNRAEKKLLEL